MNGTGTRQGLVSGFIAGADPRLAVLAIGMFAIGTDSFVIVGILPRIASDLNISVGMAGQLITAYALSYAVATPIAAGATSNMPRERVLVAGLVIFILGNLGTAFSPDIVSALASRAVSGIGAAIFAPAASATAVDLTDAHRRGQALAWMMVGLSAATAFGAPLGTALSEFFDWRTIIGLIACLGAIVALGVLVSIRSLAPPQKVTMRDRIRPLADARVIGALLVTFLVLTGLYVVYSYISVVVFRVTKGDGSILAMLLFIWGIGAVFGSALAGRLADRYGSRAIVNATLACLAINMALLYWTSAFFVASIASVLVWGICAWGFTVSQQHRLTSIRLDQSQIVLGLYASAVYLGAAAASAIGAVALRYLEPISLPLVGAAFIAAGLLVSEMTGSFRGRASASG